VGGSTAAVVATVVSGSATLSGTAIVNAVAGVATFANLVLTGSGPVTLAFSTAGLTPVSSASLTVGSTAPPGATQLAITTQASSSAQSGVAFAQQPVVELRDASNNAVAQSGIIVTAAIASGGG